MMKKIVLSIAVLCCSMLAACERTSATLTDEKRIDLAMGAIKNSFLQPYGIMRYVINVDDNGDEPVGPYAIRLILPAKTMGQIALATGDDTLLPYIRSNLIWAYQNSRYIDKGLCFASDESGANAVFLMSAIFYEQASGNKEFDFIKKPLLYCLRDTYFDPSFGFHELLSHKGPHPFYDGESWLAAALYNFYYPEDKNAREWIETVDDTLIAAYRKKSGEVFRFFHWGAQAAALRYKTTKDPKFLDFLTYMFKQLENTLPTEKVLGNMNSCTISEGLADLIEVVADPEIRQLALERFDRQMESVRRLQVTAEVLPDGTKIHPDVRPFVGLFLNGAKDRRLMPDTAQHCAAALLKASRLKPYQKYSRKKRP